MTRRSYFGRLAASATPLAALPVLANAQESAKHAAPTLDFTRFGIKGDGATDDTAAIQKALDAAATTGAAVLLPPAKYLVAGSLKIPAGVSLEGVHDSPRWPAPLAGTVILATGGRDHEGAPALFEMGSGTMVQGLTVFYPEQQATEIHPYAWTFHLQGLDNTVENVTLVNSYNGIRVGPEGNGRHRIRSVVGCALRRGIFVDHTTDIGRIENIQWHCDIWAAKDVNGNRRAVYEYMWKNLEAFIFGRTDWEYVTNTFVFPVKAGYSFIRTPAGMCNGQFSGIGADAAQRCVSVEAIQGMGLLITNGEFVSMHGDERTQVVVEPSCRGSVRLVNCAFWGPARQCVLSHSESVVSLSNCYLEISGHSSSGMLPEVSLVQADAGKLQVRGCSFRSRDKEPHVVLKKGLQHAIIGENNGVHGLDVVNEIGDQAIIVNNEPRETEAGA
jgi:hypothetical protein